MITAENNTQRWENIQCQIFRFNTPTSATAFANRCEKLHMVVLGDNGEFWVAVPAVTEWLVKNGYEYANWKSKRWKDRTVKIKIVKGKLKGTCGTVVGVYMDGRYDIKVIKPQPGQPKQMVVKVTDCEEVRY
jgi:hypothetical protein